jgi:hypothetical protein
VSAPPGCDQAPSELVTTESMSQASALANMARSPIRTVARSNASFFGSLIGAPHMTLQRLVELR